MTALLAGVLDDAGLVADAFTHQQKWKVSLVGPAGGGKATALRHAGTLLVDCGRPVVMARAGRDDMAATVLLDGLAASLYDLGYHPTPVLDGLQDDWRARITDVGLALDRTAADGLVVMVADIDRLEARTRSGGAPGQHAFEVRELLAGHAPRLAATKAVAPASDQGRIAAASDDLGDWLADADAWGPMAQAASDLAARGASWRRMPALLSRICVASTWLEAAPAHPPMTALLAGRVLAATIVGSRPHRPVWAAWQLLSSLRGPLDDEIVAALLGDLPAGLAEHPLLTRCLLFEDDGWHLHPILRQVADEPPAAAADRRVPDDLLTLAAHRVMDLCRTRFNEATAESRKVDAERARAAALDACAMIGDPALAAAWSHELPDPYDHIGRRSARDPIRASAAFGQANGIDDTDATALRGLADAADRQGQDAGRAEGFYRDSLAREPEDLESHVRLIGVLLASGRPQVARDAFDAAVVALSGTLREDELASDLAEPAARQAVAYGELDLAARAASLAHGTHAAASMARLVAGLIEALEFGEFVTAERMGSTWWRAPVLLADFDDARLPLTRWLAARVDAITDDHVSLHVADVPVPTPEERPETTWLSLTAQQLADLSRDSLPEPLLGAVLEVGVYGDGDADWSTVARVLDRTEPDLPTVPLDPDRYVRR